jgi:hypothetical protein
VIVRDLACWPPTWRRTSGASGAGVRGERGVLIAARWDHRGPLLTLVMEDAEGRHVAVPEDSVRVLSRLCLVLGWQIGQPVARIGGLEITL